MADTINHYFDLSHFGLIKVSGDDANSFLQNQITADLNKLDEHGWVLSAWCLPNGRILSNFIIFSEENHYIMVLPSMLLENIMKRLAMYILRSKVMIEDASDDYAVIGLCGTNIENVLNDMDLLFENKKLIRTKGVSIINFNDPVPRVMLVISMDKLSTKMNRIFMACEQSDRSRWSLLDIKSGIPWITESTSDSYLPQMLNLDLSGGLSFDKGCYPGQEVIARLHYRSEAKKRLYLGNGEGKVTPGPGDALEDANDGHLLGSIVDAEPDPEGGFRFLAVADINLDNIIKLQVRGSESIVLAMQPLFTR